MMLVCPCLIHRCARLARALGRRLVRLGGAVARWWRPPSARVLIVVQCGDTQRQRSIVRLLRRGLRASERVTGGLPPIPCRVRVLELAGTPPTFADLGAVRATYTVRAVDGRARAIITLAASVHGHPAPADQLVVALTAALDHLSEWQPGCPTVWALPARAGAARPHLAHGVARRLPTAIVPPVAAGLAGLGVAGAPSTDAGGDGAPLASPAPAPASLPPLPPAPPPDGASDDPLGLGQG
jgi:hypothetical protein